MSNQGNKSYSALFLDRDGVINHKIEGYVVSFSDFHFIEGVRESIPILNQIFNRIIIVTNQQGIGKKLMSVNELEVLHKRMLVDIEISFGKIDEIYYCPHLASDDCSCRKPKSGMLISAKKDFPDIDFSRSILLGDSETDIISAQKVGMDSVKLSKKYTLRDWTNDIFS